MYHPHCGVLARPKHRIESPEPEVHAVLSHLETPAFEQRLHAYSLSRELSRTSLIVGFLRLKTKSNGAQQREGENVIRDRILATCRQSDSLEDQNMARANEALLIDWPNIKHAAVETWSAA
jgi:hypothetical protein